MPAAAIRPVRTPANTRSLRTSFLVVVHGSWPERKAPICSAFMRVDRKGPRLLEHHVGDEDRVRVARPAPREIVADRGVWSSHGGLELHAGRDLVSDESLKTFLSLQQACTASSAS
jgi:hypothetical protein